MTRQEFKEFVDSSLYKLISYAELHFGSSLPSKVNFRWMIDKKNIKVGIEDTVEEITSRVFLDEDLIYPCVDLIVEDTVDNESLLIIGSVAGYAPTQFQTNWSGRRGPFIFGLNPKFIKVDTSSKEFKQKLDATKLD